jgi:hypothetical protein
MVVVVVGVAVVGIAGYRNQERRCGVTRDELELVVRVVYEVRRLLEINYAVTEAVGHDIRNRNR